MTLAEEVIEALQGHIGTCLCGESLGSPEQYADIVCACRRRYRSESPPSNSWRRYVLIDKNGRRTGYSVGTPSCRSFVHER